MCFHFKVKFYLPYRINIFFVELSVRLYSVLEKETELKTVKFAATDMPHTTVYKVMHLYILKSRDKYSGCLTSLNVVHTWILVENLEILNKTFI